MRRGRWKFLTEGRVELLFDLDADPGETKNVATQNPNVVDELKKALRDWEQDVPPDATPARPR